jgi:CubicO group peptidase (beta-lactamase class C family)
MDEPVVCDRYVFPPGPMPGVRWERPGRVRELAGIAASSVTYYDERMNEVTRADAAGRYAAVLRAVTPDSSVVVRRLTLFCTSAELDDYSPVVPFRMLPFTGREIPPGAWERYAAEMRRYSFGDLLTYPAGSPDAAVFLAGMADWDTTCGPAWTPRGADAKWWIEFKRREEGRSSVLVPDPLPLERPAPTLRPADPRRSAYSSADIDRLRMLCRRWADDLEQPLVTLIAHRGDIVFHQGFAPGGRSVPVEVPMWMASITKVLTGVLVAMAADRGIVGLDDPLSTLLPGCAGRTPEDLTPRALLTHTADLGWAGDWASDWNHALENHIALVGPTLRPGARFEYNRAGYAVMGKVLELRSGVPVSELLDRCVLRPLGMNDAHVVNSYGGLYASALDVALLGQMLLNGGAYGNYRYLSPDGVASVLPRALPASVGNAPGMRGVGTAAVAAAALSDAAYGHPAASGAVFCVDPELGLVIVSARDRVGRDEQAHREYVRRLMELAAVPARTGAVR